MGWKSDRNNRVLIEWGDGKREWGWYVLNWLRLWNGREWRWLWTGKRPCTLNCTKDGKPMDSCEVCQP